MLLSLTVPVYHRGVGIKAQRHKVESPHNLGMALIIMQEKEPFNPTQKLSFLKWNSAPQLEIKNKIHRSHRGDPQSLQN